LKKELFINLLYGVDEKNIVKKDRDEIEYLLKNRFIRLHKGKYKIDRRLHLGTLDTNRKGVGFLAPIGGGGRDIVIESSRINGALKGDLVIIKRVHSKSNRASGEVIYIAHRDDSDSLLYLKKGRFGKIEGFDLKTDLPKRIEASQKSLMQLPPLTVLRINSLSARVEEVVGVLTDPAIDEKISLALYSRPDEFSKRSETESHSFGNSVDIQMYQHREDLTPYPFCTIDPDSAKDFDDALYYDSKNRTLYVAIADVSEYVSTFSSIDSEAKERGFSIYFPHRSIPMLPRTLSENICSLKPNEDRLAFTFKIELTKSFEVKKYDLIESVIHSHRRFSYSEVDEAFKSRIDLGEHNWLYEFQEITADWRKKRLENGFDFQSEDVRIELNDNGELIDTVIETETLSHSLIEEAMLLANRLSSEMISFGIFRNHDLPSDRAIEDLRENLMEVGIFEESRDPIDYLQKVQKKGREMGIGSSVDRMIIRSLKQARYEPKNSGHFGLGFDRYSHFTSPIRRYSDLLLHRLLKATIRDDDKMTRFLLQNIEADTMQISELEREANKVMWDFDDRKFARWAYENIGEKITVTVVEYGKGDMVSKVSKGPIKGARIFIKSDEVKPLFENIEIKISEVNLASAKIYGRLN